MQATRFKVYLLSSGHRYNPGGLPEPYNGSRSGAINISSFGLKSCTRPDITTLVVASIYPALI